MEGLRKHIQTVKDYVFPVFCLSCDIEGVWVCDTCKQFLRIEPQLFCPVCHAETMHGEPCMSCRADSALVQHVAMTKYVEDALVGKLIHVFKYQYAEEVMKEIRRVMFDFVNKHPELFQNIDVLVPVPLHKKRFAERGFNQATYIARALLDALDIPLAENILTRSRHTPHQAKLDREGRMKNVENAFAVSDVANIVGKHVLLVDDVYTTGATMQACALVLKEAGAESIFGCTLARG